MLQKHLMNLNQLQPKPKRRVHFQQIPQVRIWESCITSSNSSSTKGSSAINHTDNANTTSFDTIHKDLGECKDDSQPNATLLWYSADELDQMRNDVKIQSKSLRTSLNAYISTNGHYNATATTHSSIRNNNIPNVPKPLESSLFLPFENSNVEKKMRILRYELPLHCNSSSSTTSRGLEPRIFIEKQMNRITVTRSVFEFQQRVQGLITFAKSNGRSEDAIKRMKEKYSERLGIMCAEISSWARHEALNSAGYDAMCAHQILNCTNNTNTSDCGCGYGFHLDCSSGGEEEQNGDICVEVENVLKQERRMDSRVRNIGVDNNIDELSGLSRKRPRTSSPMVSVSVAATDMDDKVF
jgi:hypothetical protein